MHRRQVAPQHVLAVTFTTRAAGELRSRLRGARRRGRAGPDVPLRGAAPAAVLLAADLPRRRARRWSRASWPAIRAAAGVVPALAVARREQRDLASRDRVGQGGAGRAGRLPRPRPGGRPRAAVRRSTSCSRCSRRTRGSTPTAASSTSRTCCCSWPRRDRERPARSPAEVHERYRHFTVDEYQDVIPLQQRLLDAWLGDRDDLCVVGDPNQTIYSFTGASPAYLRGVRQAVPRRDASCGWSATTARPTRSSRWPTGSMPESRLRAQAGDGPGADVRRRTTTSRPRRRRSVARIAALRDAGRAAARDGGAVPGQRAVGGLRSRAGRGRHPLCAARRRSGSSSGREVREAVVLLRGAARSAAGPRHGESLPAIVTDVLSATGFSDDPAERRRRRPRRAGSRCARSSGSPRSSPRRIPSAGLEEFVAELAARADAQHAPPVEGVTLASLHCGEGPGVGRRLPRRAGRRHRADHPRGDPGAGRGGAAAALRRRHPRPPPPRRCPGRSPAPPAAGGRASRRGSSTGSGRSTLLAERPKPAKADAARRPGRSAAARLAAAALAGRRGAGVHRLRQQDAGGDRRRARRPTAASSPPCQASARRSSTSTPTRSSSAAARLVAPGDTVARRGRRAERVADDPRSRADRGEHLPRR